MVIIKEATSRYKELVQTLAPLVNSYAKAMASPKAILDLTNRLATVLEQWDFTPKELKDLDKRAFLDLIKSWQADASVKDIALIKLVI